MDNVRDLTVVGLNLAHDSCVGWSQNAVIGFTWLSGCFSFVIIVVELNRKKLRVFPTNMPIIFATVALGFNLTLGIGPTLNFRQVSEFASDGTFRNICLAQAFLYQLSGAATLFWYFALTNIMYNIIVKNERVVDLQFKAKYYYVGGILIPFASAILPVIVGDVYGPRDRGFPLDAEGKHQGLECWLDDPYWQFSEMYLWVGIAAVWGTYRGFYIFLTLRKTTYKTERSREAGAMASKRGFTVLSTLKEHMMRQVAFLGLYVLFAIINIVYFSWTWSIAEQNPGSNDPCLLSLMYAVNTSLIGTYITCVFGATRENIKSARKVIRSFWRSGGGHTDGDDTTMTNESDLTNPLAPDDQLEDRRGDSESSASSSSRKKANNNMADLAADLEAGLEKIGQNNKSNSPKRKAQPATRNKVVSMQSSLARKESSTVTTHLGTKINAKLGIINSPAADCTSTFDDKAVSGMSVPPANHPLTAKLEAMRDRYTKNILTYVLERIEVLALDETIAMEFMDEIETQSHSLFDASVLESKYSTAGSVEDDYNSFFEGQDDDLLPTKDDIDERLRKAKAKFEEILRSKSVDRG
jgi:hypothetical protein